MNKIAHGFCPICYKASVHYVEIYKSLVCTHCNTPFWDSEQYANDVDAKRETIAYAMWEVGQRRRDLFNAIWDKIDPILAYPIGKLADAINKLSQLMRKLENE